MVAAGALEPTEVGWLNAEEGFAPNRPIGGCPTGTPVTVCPGDANRVAFKLFAPRTAVDEVEPAPVPVDALLFAGWFLLKILSAVGTCTNPGVPALAADCGAVE